MTPEQLEILKTSMRENYNRTASIDEGVEKSDKTYKKFMKNIKGHSMTKTIGEINYDSNGLANLNDVKKALDLLVFKFIAMAEDGKDFFENPKNKAHAVKLFELLGTEPRQKMYIDSMGTGTSSVLRSFVTQTGIKLISAAANNVSVKSFEDLKHEDLVVNPRVPQAK